MLEKCCVLLKILPVAKISTLAIHSQTNKSTSIIRDKKVTLGLQD